jgi:hypothetical protein
VLGIKVPPRGAMVKGSAMHKTIATYYKTKRDLRKELSALDLGDHFKKVFEMESPAVDWEKEEDKQSDIIDRGYGLLKIYREVVGIKTRPLDVERDVTVTFANVPYDFRVIADLIDKKGIVHDAKVKSRMLSEEDIKNDLQLTVEAMAYRALYKKAETGIVMDILLDKKIPDVKQIRAKRSLQDINRALSNVSQVNNAISAGVFYCVHPSESWICSEKWCGYYDLHREFSKLVVKYGGPQAVALLKEKYQRGDSQEKNGK